MSTASTTRVKCYSNCTKTVKSRKSVTYKSSTDNYTLFFSEAKIKVSLGYTYLLQFLFLTKNKFITLQYFVLTINKRCKPCYN